MPTYQNNSNLDVDIVEIGLHLRAKEIASSILVIPETLLSTKYANLGVIQTDIHPCYNPIIAEHGIVFTAPGDEQEVVLNVMETNYVEVCYSTTIVLVFLQAKTNEPPIRVGATDMLRLRTTYRVEKLIFVPDCQGELLVIEYKDHIKYDRWTRGSFTLESNVD